MMTFEQFVRPALRLMGGFARWKETDSERDVAGIDRERWARDVCARLGEPPRGQWQARLSGGQGRICSTAWRVRMRW